MTRPGLFTRMLRFGLTGLFVTGVHFVVAIALVEFAGASPPLANGVAFTVATIVAFLINSLWSFRTGFDAGTLLRYVCVACLGLGVTVAVATLMERLGVHYILGIVAVTLSNPPLMFVLHNRWTFRQRPAPLNCPQGSSG
ncbi:GtrA family protein [Sandaracinobacteroides sp. A072]|uniref:GtrA family protein n=1 Tax=Sandaracinobacteroides sp. A072 TaxID=3461146 RepID=UPI0040428B7C